MLRTRKVAVLAAPPGARGSSAIRAGQGHCARRRGGRGRDRRGIGVNRFDHVLLTGEAPTAAWLAAKLSVAKGRHPGGSDRPSPHHE